MNNSSYMPSAHTPVMSNNSKLFPTKFDFFNKNDDETSPSMFRSKDESAPNYIFSTY
jgi:hypothetical protein